mmetsp:Transcript_7662/g.15202  ORF Transcript_7662/g.15202 Transcript_7662/m.15202 type:complete len:100 (-) Transcript_7662:609-908(-)|eukprot:CAMPEP_0171488874 /NCGR_PEP_ID=MMETSP0958-20121227/2444_1 /TAXON_ID=87120 /ORGANISM="Aurantiochytrium limacinum, Strain ATCCMYA-1381" /LENGTH=99 /DNA_ID=CAMNT_0012022025 /DNA_START=280 /DNA_END=579 /DNA_ORIENTATION=+
MMHACSLLQTCKHWLPMSKHQCREGKSLGMNAAAAKAALLAALAGERPAQQSQRLPARCKPARAIRPELENASGPSQLWKSSQRDTLPESPRATSQVSA